MKIKIYQVNHERDRNRVAFAGMDELPQLQGKKEVDSSAYDLVYKGSTDCRTLEDVYRKFNVDHPAGYRARSLSVSDVVEIEESPHVKTGFYYCDRIGFKSVSFEPEKADKGARFCDGNEVKTISVLLVQTGKHPKKVEIEDRLEAMQELVGGGIEEYMPFEEDDVAIICNEEGKLKGLPLNRAVYGKDGEVLDVIAGDFFIAYAPIYVESYLSLPEELERKYSDKFRQPERFFHTDEGVKAVPYALQERDRER